MIQSSHFLTDFVLVCLCFTGLIACYKNLKFHVRGVHMNALQFGVAKIWKSSVVLHINSMKYHARLHL